MKVRTKKIIAKEFILAVITLTISIIAFFITFPYDYNFNRKINKLNTSIDKMIKTADSLSADYDKKADNQDYFFSEFNNKYGEFYKSKEELFIRLDELLKKDSIKIKWEKVWDKDLINLHISLGFPNSESFINFLSQNIITDNDRAFKNESDSLKIKIEGSKLKINIFNSKKLTFADRINFSLMIFLCVIFFLFLLRYIFYGIQWSLKILKDDNNPDSSSK